jgi:hypothetical protein
MTKFWHEFEYFNDSNNNVSIFADRKVITFIPGMGIIDPQTKAYAIYDLDSELSTFETEWQALLNADRANEIEAIIIGILDYFVDLVDIATKASDRLPNLKALFLGDMIEDGEYRLCLYPFCQDIDRVLLAYERLEYLQMRFSNVRNGRTGEKMVENYSFCQPLTHDFLRVLRIESSGLHHQVLLDLNRLELPELEYLELWTGDSDIESEASVFDIMPIINGDKFPKLKYLGLKNCNYTDDIAFAIATSPLLKNLVELDLSMGTLTNAGLLALLGSQHINELETLNISQNYITQSFIKVVLPTLETKCNIIVDNQRRVDEFSYSSRACVFGYY